jgi:hypothetical protein
MVALLTVTAAMFTALAACGGRPPPPGAGPITASAPIEPPPGRPATAGPNVPAVIW